jgi:hypothetical protein
MLPIGDGMEIRVTPSCHAVPRGISVTEIGLRCLLLATSLATPRPKSDPALVAFAGFDLNVAFATSFGG